MLVSSRNIKNAEMTKEERKRVRVPTREDFRRINFDFDRLTPVVISLSKEEIEWAKKEARHRYLRAIKFKRVAPVFSSSLGQRPLFRDYIGVLAEVATAKYLETEIYAPGWEEEPSKEWTDLNHYTEARGRCGFFDDLAIHRRDLGKADCFFVNCCITNVKVWDVILLGWALGEVIFSTINLQRDKIRLPRSRENDYFYWYDSRRFANVKYLKEAIKSGQIPKVCNRPDGTRIPFENKTAFYKFFPGFKKLEKSEPPP